MTGGALAERMTRVARARSWWWPASLASATFVIFTLIVWRRIEVDLGTYLMGGAHAFSPSLYRMLYPPTGLGFTYPPFPALLFAPFSHLPLRVDTVAFTWLGLAAVFGLLAVSLRATAPALDRRTVLWWALGLVGPAVLLAPVRETLTFGQVNLILALAVVADMTMDLPVPRGILVGLAAAVKLTPAVLIPYLFLTRRIKAGWTALAAFAGAGLLSAAATPRAFWAYWTHDAWAPGRAGPLAFVGNQGVVGVLERLLDHPLSTGTTFAVVLAVSAVGLAVGTAAHRRSWAVLGLIVMEATDALASPVSWDHHYVWIILLISWLALGADRPAHGIWWSGVVAVTFWAAPIWWVPHGHDVRIAGHGWSLPLANFFFLVLVTVVAATAVHVARAGRGDPPDRAGSRPWPPTPAARPSGG
ncbi:MAG: glycosyltransferase 87 family protein [Acidimicrobiales bacterium]